jgi:hypothetical protein
MKKNSEMSGYEKSVKRSYSRTGLYTQLDEQNLDGRTTLAKLVKELGQELNEYVGNRSIVSDILIQRIIFKHIRLASYESKFIENPDSEEKQHYLPMANSLRLDLQALAGLAGKSKPPDLGKYIETNYSKEKHG